jgi:hypothetical protein
MHNNSEVSKLPEVLWHEIFKFETIKEFVTFRCVCKRFKGIADLYTDIYERECLRIFTSNLRLFTYYSHISFQLLAIHAAEKVQRAILTG